MSQRDFILRLIEQFGASWARIVRQLDAKLFPSARASVHVAYQQYLGLDAETAQALGARDLLARVRFGAAPETANERSLILSTLLKAEGDIAANEQQPDHAAMFYQKALDVLLTTRLHAAAVLPAFVPQVEVLVDALANYMLPASTLRLLLAYYEHRGDYAKAEDALFELRRQTPAAAQTLGVAFYRHLDACTDAQLQAGNFSRQEIAAGRKALEL